MARAGERHEATIGVGPAGYEADLADLADATPETVAGYLTAHSGLPGPRANLALADAFAAVAPADLVRQFVGSADEFLAFCATEALGRLCLSPADRAGALAELRRAAADPRWRVREGAARALQLLGDAEPELLYPVIDEWASAPDPWLARAAVAAICEPRLLHEPIAQALALRACGRATALLLGAPVPVQPAEREAHRVLRLALGYTWSVAIAASPEAGLAAFRALAARDEPDARWIVRSNLTKKRLRSVVTERNLWGLFG
ncbi:MAG: HEAT repeat domain-containing protein [Cryobacterium sp.]